MLLTAILTLVITAFAACGAPNQEATGELTAHPLHADLDYMLHTLENNFALFDVAYWARGVDIYAIVDDVRAEIEAYPDMDVDGFYKALIRNFWPLGDVAHFAILSPERHSFFVDDPQGRNILWFLAPSNYARLRQPNVIAFYEPRHPAQEAAQDFFAMPDDTNIFTEIIEEGRIAYLSVTSFVFHPERIASDTAKTFNFYEEIQGFDHLIVDLRHSGGGNYDYFVNAIVAPNIDELVVLDAFYFLVYGEYSSEFIHPRTFQRVLSAANPVRTIEADLGKRPVGEILSDFDLPHFNMADAERLHYGIHSQLRIQPARLAAFDGTIWVLIGPGMWSASQIAAWIAKESGVATLVGEITSGHYGGPRTMVALPNSGIVFMMDVFYVTDHHGRPLEAGTIPHYFNRPGMDALETVLAMIEEDTR